MSSGFVTESEAAEARQRRQEEWERVRKPEDPLERPEEPYDGRSLFERLKEQKVKKDMEYEEAHKLKNLIRGLDDDEVQFLELVDQQKISAERKQALEEEKELKEFRNRVATLQEEFADKRLQSEIKLSKGNTAASTSCARPSQKKLLGLGIKRKNGEGTSCTDANSGASTSTKNSNTEECKESFASNDEPASVAPKTHLSITTNRYDKGALKCVAILPGIGTYTESSDSEMSTGSEEEFGCEGKYDLCGRKRQKKKDCNED